MCVIEYFKLNRFELFVCMCIVSVLVVIPHIYWFVQTMNANSIKLYQYHLNEPITMSVLYAQLCHHPPYPKTITALKSINQIENRNNSTLRHRIETKTNLHTYERITSSNTHRIEQIESNISYIYHHSISSMGYLHLYICIY